MGRGIYLDGGWSSSVGRSLVGSGGLNNERGNRVAIFISVISGETAGKASERKKWNVKFCLEPQNPVKYNL